MTFITTIAPGDQVTDMSDHQPRWRSFLDWETYSPFEISQLAFNSLHQSMAHLRNDVLMNKMAYAISSTTDIDGEISSIVVMYQHDDTYHIAMLLSPKWKNLL